jgi:hypothetical protein
MTLDPGSEMEKFESGKNIPDPQHCVQVGTVPVVTFREILFLGFVKNIFTGNSTN